MDGDGETSRELIRLWRVFKTVRQMCADRVCANQSLSTVNCRENVQVLIATFKQGYQIMEDEIDISLDDFRRKYADDSGNPSYVHALPPRPDKVSSNVLHSRPSISFNIHMDSCKL
jgi:hypothetical protein